MSGNEIIYADNRIVQKTVIVVWFMKRVVKWHGKPNGFNR